VRLRLLAEAQQEIYDAAAWYERRQRGLGAEFLDAVAHALAAIEQSPERFAVFEAAPAERNVRQRVSQRFAYRIIDPVLAQEALVAAASRARRTPGALEALPVRS